MSDDNNDAGPSFDDMVASRTKRSIYMMQLFKSSLSTSAPGQGQRPPAVVVTFWDDAEAIPRDVRRCMESWAPVDALGFERRLFDDVSASSFIDSHYGPMHNAAFRRCAHPAMRADYFRLCYLLKEGGFYVDADDEYQGGPLDKFIEEDRLQLQALCYDENTDQMVDPAASLHRPEPGRIYYLNNNPLIAPSGNPIIERALGTATQVLNAGGPNARDVQAATGPGNLTLSVIAELLERPAAQDGLPLAVIFDWEKTAVSKWPLSYRSDDRNWRNWTEHGA